MEKLAVVLIIPSSWGSQLDGEKLSTPRRINGPCHIHSMFIDGKRVSRHVMKDCKKILETPGGSNKQTSRSK
jgi:hypothetical protein